MSELLPLSEQVKEPVKTWAVKGVMEQAHGSSGSWVRVPTGPSTQYTSVSHAPHTCVNKGGHTHVRTGAASAVAGGVVALFVPPIVRTSREAGASAAGSTRLAQRGWLNAAGSKRLDSSLALRVRGSSLPALLGVFKRQGSSGHGRLCHSFVPLCV